MGLDNNIFAGTKQPRDLTKYALLRGVPDYTNLQQFNLYESGYSFLIVVSIPKFLEVLAANNEQIRSMVQTYVHCLEYEFRGLDGIDNITSETGEITNGISTLNLINKVNSQSGSTFQMRYFEKAGSLLTKMNKYILTGIKDDKTQVKTYHGALRPGRNGEAPLMTDYGPEYEVFEFLYFTTDNAALQIEQAFFIAAAQPTTAELNIYNSERGDIGFKELSMEFQGYPIAGVDVTAKAKKYLDWINANTEFMSSRFAYQSITNMKMRA